MSKKNKNTNVNTDAVNQEVENVEATEAVETTGVPVEAPVEEVKAEEPVETKVEEAPVEETPVVEDVPIAEPEAAEEPVVEATPVEEAPAPDVSGIKVTMEGEEEGPVDYFVQLNKEPFTDEKLAMVEERLDKYSLSRFVTADGIVLVGPYLTKDGAINGRRLVIRSGLKGEIVEIPKDK